MDRFIGFAVDGYNPEKRAPVSTGATRDEAQSSAIRRVLSLGITDGSIEIVKQDKLTADEFGEMRDILDAWFAEKGIH